MSNTAESKICPLCAETIKATAKVCPHCRHFQKIWSFSNPNIVGLFYVILFATLFTGVGLFMENLFRPKHDFSPSRDRIGVQKSQMSFRGGETNNLIVTAVGVITNGGDASWKDVGLEVQFYDSFGNLIDVISHTGEYSRWAILKHAEAAFKLEGKAARKEADYATHKIYVRWAKTADSWP
jgi:hypothetical protein